MGDATTSNGNMPHSATLEHLDSYHFVHDAVEAFKGNPYGQKSLELSNEAFEKLVKPFFPYLETPASYAKPYAIKIDDFGNIILTKLDEKFPVLKSETDEVKSWVIGRINWPLEKAKETKTYVLDTYSEEYKKCGGDGYVAGGKAVITSSLVLTSDTLTWLSNYLSAKKEEAKEATKETADKAEKKADEASSD